MKKGTFLLKRYFLMLLFCLLLTACGQEAGDYEMGSASLEYYDIKSEQKDIFEGKEDENSTFVGMQYFQGEPIQLWLSYEEEGKKNLYLCRTDGSRELLLEGPESGDGVRWYLDEDGSLYCWKRSFDMDIPQEAPYIRKLDGSGREIFRKELQQGILLWDFCRMEDGTILLLLQEGRGESLKLSDLNPRTGALSERPGVRLEHLNLPMYIAAGNQGVLLLETGYSEGISEVSMEDGSVLSAQSFLGTTYSMDCSLEEMEVRNFRLSEDGMVEILWADPISGRGVQETLRLSRMSKTPIILQALDYMAGEEWLQKRIGDFNRKNSKYQVIMEQSSVDDGEIVAARMAAGKGPDILYGNTLEWVYGLVEKGGLEDLAPHMKESGMLEEEYFPYAFSCLRDGEKIYTFRLGFSTPSFLCIKKEILGGRQVTDIEELLDALLAWEGDAWMNGAAVSRWVLNRFYDCEDFWGMIDWENGTCDFSKDLFVKMLKMAKKYGVSWEKALAADYESRMIAERSRECTLLGYKTSAELEKMGLFNVTALLNGTYATTEGTTFAIAINANSVQKEGAWEFLRYMMSEEVQMTMTDFNDRINRHAHLAGIEQNLKWLDSEENATISEPKTTHYSYKREIIEEYQDIYTKEEMTQERIDEYLDALETAKDYMTMAYVRLMPIYIIVEEEAEYYFSDAKSLEEVVDIINSRVGLYVGEQH